MSKQVELVERRAVRDAMPNVAEARGGGEKDVLGGRRGAERSKLPNGVASAANTIEQTVAHQASEEVARRRGRAAETCRGFLGRELAQPLADELVEQTEAACSCSCAHSSRFS